MPDVQPVRIRADGARHYRHKGQPAYFCGKREHEWQTINHPADTPAIFEDRQPRTINLGPKRRA